MVHTPQRLENDREEPERGRRERQAACSRGHQCWLGPEGAAAQGGLRKRVWSESQSGHGQPGVLEAGEGRGHRAPGAAFPTQGRCLFWKQRGPPRPSVGPMACVMSARAGGAGEGAGRT